MLIEPASLDELTEAVRSTPRLLPVGATTKPRLSACDIPKLSTARLSGIIEYEPGEFTFTALAGTPMREVAAVLAQCGQCLPFDPVLLAAGATLGGTVAAGINGPGRIRFGGIRDFILGVRFVDGRGRLLRMGGKVVKNAAGFDVPKFLVGSLGRFGVLAECTFKVFPLPESRRTLRIEMEGLEAAVHVLTSAATSRWQPEALEFLPHERSILMRLAGPAAALKNLSNEVQQRWPCVVLRDEEANRAWTNLGEFQWTHPGGVLVKVPLTLNAVAPFVRAVSAACDQTLLHISAAGDVGFVSLPAATSITDCDSQLVNLGLTGMVIRGAGPLFCGSRRRTRVSDAVKTALDPDGRFPSIE